MAEQILRKKIDVGISRGLVRSLKDVDLDDLQPEVLFGLKEVIWKRYEFKGNFYIETLQWGMKYDYEIYYPIVDKNRITTTKYLLNHKNKNVFSVREIGRSFGEKGRATYWDEKEEFLIEAGK
jgi:hypothetical protein